MSIKYYRLAKGEELPEEFCAVRDVNGEPSEYTWYERMSEFERELWVLFTKSDWFAGSEYRKLQAENAKLREERDYHKALWQNTHVTAGELRRVRAAWKKDREQNAKLRDELDRMIEAVEALHSVSLEDQLVQALNVADKLRELVEDMLDCIDIQIAFERVPARWMQDEFAGRARELGVEVDDG